MNRTKPYLNKFILQKQLEITDNYHKQNMKEMQPITSRLMQHTETIIINHSKGQKIKQIREIQIQRENQSLLERMSSVLSKQGLYSPQKYKNFRTKVNKSLNQIFRKKQEENIALQNKRYQIRLVNKKPTLNLEKIDRDWKNNKRAMQRMSNCQFYLTSFRPKDNQNRSRLASSIEIKNKMEASKISKVTVVDGHKMTVTIELVNGFLKIISNVHNNKKVQVIDIPKEQAVVFIRRYCEGKMENILKKFRYDSRNEVLYVMTNEQTQNSASEKEANPEEQVDLHEGTKKSQIKVDESSSKSKSKPSIQHPSIQAIAKTQNFGQKIQEKQVKQNIHNNSEQRQIRQSIPLAVEPNPIIQQNQQYNKQIEIPTAQKIGKQYQQNQQQTKIVQQPILTPQDKQILPIAQNQLAQIVVEQRKEQIVTETFHQIEIAKQ